MRLRTILISTLAGATFLLYCQKQAEIPPAPSWEVSRLNRPASIRGLSVVNEQVAWLSGSSNTIARTTDGGINWTLLTPPTEDSLDFRDIEAFDSLSAVLMSAGSGEQSRVFLTEDGGRSWRETLRNKDPAGFYNGIAFWNKQEGLLTGDPVDGSLFLMRTEDGGDTWQRVSPAHIPEVDSMEYGFAASGSHITVSADSLAWVGTGGLSARVFHSADGGRQWSAFPTPMISGAPSTGIFSVAFLDEKTGIAVGGDYTQPTLIKNNLMTTRDGGRSWLLVEGHQVAFRSCIRVINGWYLTCGPSGTDISYDKGLNWHRIDTIGYHVLDVGDSPEAIWAAGSEGRIGKIVWRRPN